MQSVKLFLLRYALINMYMSNDELFLFLLIFKWNTKQTQLMCLLYLKMLQLAAFNISCSLLIYYLWFGLFLMATTQEEGTSFIALICICMGLFYLTNVIVVKINVRHYLKMEKFLFSTVQSTQDRNDFATSESIEFFF